MFLELDFDYETPQPILAQEWLEQSLELRLLEPALEQGMELQLTTREAVESELGLKRQGGPEQLGELEQRPTRTQQTESTRKQLEELEPVPSQPEEQVPKPRQRELVE